MSKEEIIATLDPLFAQARREGLWFYGSYHDIWFSPDELRAHQANGQFVWGAVNWKLRDPRELLASREQAAANTQSSITDTQRRIAEWERSRR